MRKKGESRRKATIVAVLTVILSLMAVFVGCDAAFGGMKSPSSPFFAQLEGKIDGTDVKALVYCDPTAHKTKEIYNKLTVTFDLPVSLDGITVSLRSDGKATVRLRDTDEEKPLFSGLAEPFLFLLGENEPYSVRRLEDGYEVIYERDGERLICVFDSNGTPRSAEGKYCGREIALSVTIL